MAWPSCLTAYKFSPPVGDFTSRLWDVATGEELQKREWGDSPGSMVLHPNGHTILQQTGYVIYTWDLQEWNGPHGKLLGHGLGRHS